MSYHFFEQDTAGCNDYLPVAGLPQLRKAIVAFHKEWEGVELNEDGLVVGPGSKELIYLTMAVFSGTVWLCAPAWTTYNPQARLAGHQAKLLQQPQHQGWKLSPTTVEQGLKGLSGPHLLILTNPGNPSGCAYTRDELEALVQVFRRLKVIVLSDEIYARLEYTGQHVCLAELYPEVRASVSNLIGSTCPRVPGHDPHLRIFQVVKRWRLEAWLRSLSLTIAAAQKGHQTRHKLHKLKDHNVPCQC